MSDDDLNSQLQSVFEQLQCIYQRLADKKDVSTAQQLKLEGQIEWLLEAKLCTRQQLIDFIQQLFQQHQLTPPATIFWQWSADNNSFYLPLMMHEAPVYKGH